jgi:hypothetical protein
MSRAQEKSRYSWDLASYPARRGARRVLEKALEKALESLWAKFLSPYVLMLETTRTR